MDRAGTAVRGQDRPRRRRLAGRAGLDGSRIGIIGLEPYPPFYFDGAVPARTLQGMTQALPKAEFVPVYKAFFRRASVKSEEELGLVRYAPPSAKP